MTLEEFLLFSGKPSQMEEYQALLKRRDRLMRRINRLSETIFFEDDCLSVFVGELTDRDRTLVERHQKVRREAVENRDKALRVYQDVLTRIHGMQVQSNAE